MDVGDSDTSDEELIQKKALEVEFPDNFDPNTIPQTGEEYLHHVIYERTKKCRKWVTAKEDFTKFKNKQNVHISNETKVDKAMEKFYPTKEWQDKALRDFVQLRNFISNTEKCEPIKEPISFANLIEKIQKSPPKFSEITAYSQAAKIKMLDDITDYLDEFDKSTGISENLGAWIYSILVLLEKPLTPDCYFILREFAKKCAKIRAKLDDEDDKEIAVPLNLFICVIARYFNQLDLIDLV